MRKLGLALLIAAAVISFGSGLRLLLTPEFFPYHAAVAGKSWSQLDPGIQSLVLGLLKVMGGGFAACGLALGWLLLPIGRREQWAGWAALTIAAAVWLPTLYVAVALRSFAPQAETPVLQVAGILVFVAVGVTLAFLAKPANAASRR